jgi:predicted GTPase
MISLVRATDCPATARRVLILGAAGRDFHNFNVIFRDDPTSIVVGFTASQIPGIAGRRYPATLAGARYPEGIPIDDEADLEALCHSRAVDEVVFAYSDVPHEHVMHLASRALSVGADFVLLGPERTMLRSSRHRDHSRTHWLRQVADCALVIAALARTGNSCRRASASNAVWRPRQ